MRHVIAAAITLFWACMMFSLVVEHVIPERRAARSSLVEPEILAMQWLDVQEWNWIREKGVTRGAACLEIARNFEKLDDSTPEDEAYVLIQNTDVRVKAPLAGFAVPLRTRLVVGLTRRLNVAKFAAIASFPPLTLRVEGFVSDNRLYYRVTGEGSEPLYGSVALRRPLSLLPAVEPMIARHFDLKVGDSYTQEVIDPIGNLKPLRARVVVAAKEKIAWGGNEEEVFRIDSTIGDVTRSRWVSEKGATLRSELFMGLVSERAFKKDVLAAYPGLREELTIPKFDEDLFKKKAAENAGPNAPSPEALQQLLGPMLRGN